MKITFFNPYHNGDVNVSRSFVRKIMERAPEHTYKYSHKNPANLLADIPNLAYDPIGINNVPNDSVGDICQGRYDVYKHVVLPAELQVLPQV